MRIIHRCTTRKAIAVIFSLPFIAVLLPTCVAQPKDPRSEIELGKKQKSFRPPPVNEAAASRAEKAVHARESASVSDQLELAIKRGNSALDRLEVEKAEKWYRQALSLNPSEARAYYGLGEVYWIWSGRDRWTDARQAYDEAIRLRPDYLDAHFALAQAHYIRGEYAEAIEPYNQTLRLDPNNYMANYDLGGIYLYQKRYDEALKQFQRMVQLKPNWDGYYKIGRIYAAQERYGEAIEAYKQSLRLDSNTAAQFYLGIAYYNQERYTDAVGPFKLYGQGASKNQPQAYVYLGNTYFRLQRYADATEQYRQAVRLKPDLSVAHFGLGLASLKLRDRSTAMEQYQWLKDHKEAYAGELLAEINKQ